MKISLQKGRYRKRKGGSEEKEVELKKCLAGGMFRFTVRFARTALTLTTTNMVPTDTPGCYPLLIMYTPFGGWCGEGRSLFHRRKMGSP
ncbi:MAG: hypothetical protein D3910_00710 [Candidatus Electrothrix sp. ATG2]|nr:hypothetical protein [Candidatus Electrothrix sp. ATG2]